MFYHRPDLSSSSGFSGSPNTPSSARGYHHYKHVRNPSGPFFVLYQIHGHHRPHTRSFIWRRGKWRMRMEAARSGKGCSLGCWSFCSSVFCKPQSSLENDPLFSVPAGLRRCIFALYLQSSASKATRQSQFQNNSSWNRRHARPLTLVGYLAVSRAVLPRTSFPGECRVAAPRYRSLTAPALSEPCHAAPHCNFL